jgi:hypothetical protein
MSKLTGLLKTEYASHTLNNIPRAYSHNAGCGDRERFIARPKGLSLYGIPALALLQ